jgi:serine/threonine-protein kinase
VIEQCCRGASAIHASGATHGDLKPGNVLLGPAFRVALADLGLSRALDRSEASYTAGTPAYMAPESTDPTTDPALLRRRDVYSLGVMAYEFLTGRLPRPPRMSAAATDTGRTYDQPLRQAPPPTPPSQLRSELPSVFDAVLLSALALDPAERTDGVDSLRRELMRARRVASERKFAAKVLVVDDDADFLALVDVSLRAAFPGAQIFCVADGARALEELERARFDLCIFDLRLPDLNGLELTATLRAEERHRQTPILIVTAHGGGRDWQLLSGLGADGFLVKPVDPHALTAMVGRMLEIRKRAR